MVMAPTQLSSSRAAPRKKRVTRSVRQATLDEHVNISPPLEELTGGARATRSKVPAVRKTQSTNSVLSSVVPRRGRSALKTSSLQESELPAAPFKSTTTTRSKRKLPTNEVEENIPNGGTNVEGLGEEEEDDGFAFRRKNPRTVKIKTNTSPTAKKATSKSTEEPLPTKPTKATKTTSKTTRSKRQKKAESEEPIEQPEVPPIVNGQGHQENGKTASNGTATAKKTKKAPSKKKTATRKKKAVEPPAETSANEFNFNGVADYPDIESVDVQRPPVPKHKSNNPFINQPVPESTSTYQGTSFQNPLVGEFMDGSNGPLFSPGAATPPPVIAKSQQISLPLSDTPIIRKNQEMRKTKTGVRRSSLGNRGKRASSIGNGFVAVPHSAVNPKEFYKHLDADLPEPHRMKQLLLWSLKRVMESQEETFEQIKVNPAISAEDRTAIKIARYIQEEIVRDVTDGRINTGWWNRPEDSDLTETVKKPNVQNVTNQRNYEAFEKRHNELLKEQEQWQNKLNEVRRAASLISTPTSATKSKGEQDNSVILKEYPLLASLQNDKSNSGTIVKLRECLNEMEQEVDRLDDFTHRASAVSKAAVLFSSSRMSQLKEQLSESRQTRLSASDSILSSLVEASEVKKSAAESKTPDADQSSSPSMPPSAAAGVTTTEGVPIRDILRTITRLERNSPS